MFSSSRPNCTQPLTPTMNRRSILLGGTALALGGGAMSATRSSAGEGHSPLKPDSPAHGVAPLSSLLAMVPASYFDLVESRGFHWQYDDLARQFASFGMHHDIEGPGFDNEPVANATLPLTHASNVFNFARVDEVTDAIGFKPFGMDQMLQVGDPGRTLTLFRGGFDPERLVSAWSASGYESWETGSGIPAWTIGTEGEFVPNHPIQGKILSELNNVAIIDDVLIAAPYMDLLELALSFAGGDEPSLAEHPVYGPVIDTLPETTVSAAGVPPSHLDIPATLFNEEQLEAAESRLAEAVDEFGPMPLISGLVTAVNEGATIVDFDWVPEGSPEPEPRDDAGTAFIRMCTASDDDAAQAVEVAAKRWETYDTFVTKVPFSKLATIETQSTHGEVGALDLRQVQHARLWLEIFTYGDVLPFIAE